MEYFTVSHSEMKDNDRLFTSNIENCPNVVKLKATAKFADKVLIWFFMKVTLFIG